MAGRYHSSATSRVTPLRAHYLPLDGTVFRMSRSDTKPFVGNVSLGFSGGGMARLR
jgi:hypothetical protein